MQNNTVLTDDFERKHNYLRISLIEKCNLSEFYLIFVKAAPLFNPCILGDYKTAFRGFAQGAAVVIG